MRSFPSKYGRSLVCALAAILAVALAPSGSSAVGHNGGDVRLIVRLRPGLASATVHALIRRSGAEQVEQISPLRVRVLRVPRARLGYAVAELGRSRAVARVERDRVVYRAADVTPNDTRWPSQWSPVRTSAPKAWTATTGSADTVVALLDSGVDFSHPDLQGAFVPGWDFVNDDGDPSDDLGHGTLVAGVVGARSNNGLGVASYCWRCSIMPLKVIGADGSATVSAVVSALAWATDHGARVINMSFGGTVAIPAIQEAVQYAHDRGVVLVAAAGNNGNSVPFYPAAYPGVLGVGGVDETDQRYSWSDFGSWVKLVAPGCNESTARGGSYETACGTSTAGPVVAGLAGLAASFAPRASGVQIENALLANAVPVADIAYGRVDAARTLDSLGADIPLSSPPASTAPGENSAEPDTVHPSTGTRTEDVRHGPRNRPASVPTGPARPSAAQLRKIWRLRVTKHARRRGVQFSYRRRARAWQPPAARRWVKLMRESHLFLLVEAARPR